MNCYYVCVGEQGHLYTTNCQSHFPSQHIWFLYNSDVHVSHVYECIYVDYETISYHQGLSQQCYSQPHCVAGSEIETLIKNPTPKDCCAGTNDGQSYADSGKNCIVKQCVGKITIIHHMHMKIQRGLNCGTPNLIMCMLLLTILSV